MTARNAPTTWAGAFYQPLMFGLALFLGGIAVVVWFLRYSAFGSRGLIGVDRALFVELGNRWQATGSMYAPWQFSPYAFDQAAGTTDVTNMPGLYPPIVGPVFAVLDVLPAPVWWLIPLTALGYLVVAMRPAPWSWPLLAGILALPQVSACVMTGNVNMWIVAGIASGLRYGWPVLVIAVKPTFVPFLLAGVRHRSFWVGAVILGAVSLVFLPEWFRYVEVISNAESPGLLYSLGDYPFMLLPVVAWYARER
jgi:hypothetical protein